MCWKFLIAIRFKHVREKSMECVGEVHSEARLEGSPGSSGCSKREQIIVASAPGYTEFSLLRISRNAKKRASVNLRALWRSYGSIRYGDWRCVALNDSVARPEARRNVGEI